jgi:hypothetical protein
MVDDDPRAHAERRCGCAWARRAAALGDLTTGAGIAQACAWAQRGRAGQLLDAGDLEAVRAKGGSITLAVGPSSALLLSVSS